MTRFTRAKGSKASNERLPNEPTPWHVLKQQLEISLEKDKKPETKTKSAKELLQEKDDPFYFDTLGATNNDWAEFEDSVKNSKQNKNDNVNKKSKLKTEKIEEDAEHCKVNNEIINIVPENKQSKKINKKIEIKNTDKYLEKDELNKTVENKKTDEKKNIDESESNSCKVNNKNKRKEFENKDTSKFVKKLDSSNDNEICEKQESDDKKEDKKNINKFDTLTKRQKRNLKKRNKNKDSVKEEIEQKPGEFNVTGNEWSTEVNFGKKRKHSESEDANQSMNSKFQKTKPDNFRKPNISPESNFKRKQCHTKLPKVRDDKEHKRRKPDTGATTMIINGLEIEVVKFDGFPVKKEDAERLKDLRKQMVLKGIPKSEINSAMKLERRKAEKALAKVRKQVCFHCRKAGHNLSDCPELGKEEAGTGICFKCGSTEHTHFECKVKKPDEYSYAKCFICREQGHIAKQCPDNPKGLYPDGGSCKICGDVTHLKKDCPDLVKEKEDNSITLSTIKDDKLEDIDEGTNQKSNNKQENVNKKIVKF